jgi:hypothetical protein
MNATRFLLGAGAAALGTLPFCGCASPPARTGGSDEGITQLQVIDTRATDDLKRMTDFLSSQPRLQFDTTVFYEDYKVGDMKVQYARHVSVEIERPNHAAGVSDGDTGRRRFWYDGSQVTAVDETAHTYSQFDVPDTYDRMVQTMADEYDTPLPVADFLTGDAYQRLMEGVQSALYLGEHHVGDDLCDHLAFEGEDRDWQVWIMPGAQPLLRKLVVAYKTLPNCPEYIAIFQHWNLSPTFTDADFKPVIPPDAIKVERLTPRRPAPAGKS